MSWWLAILLGYLVVGWSLTLVILWWNLVDEQADCGSWTLLRRQAPTRFWIGVGVMTLLVGPLSPLLLLHCLWAVVRSSLAWRKLARTHREAIMEPIHPANVPQAGQKHFERCTPHLQSLGFVAAGTYLFKPQPLPVYIDCLLSTAGETVADLALIGDDVSVSFVSVLEEGHVLETTCSADPLPEEEIEAINRSGRFTAQMLKGDLNAEALARTYRQHLERLIELERRLNCGTLHLALDQVPALKRYENARFGEVLFARGKLDNQPQPQPPPAGAAKRISSAARGTMSGAVLPAAGSALASVPTQVL